MSSVATTLKLPQLLRKRVAVLAKQRAMSSQDLMIDAIFRQVERDERMHAFVREAQQSDEQIEKGGNVYAAKHVHRWLKGMARGKKTVRPKPARSRA